MSFIIVHLCFSLVAVGEEAAVKLYCTMVDLVAKVGGALEACSLVLRR